MYRTVELLAAGAPAVLANLYKAELQGYIRHDVGSLALRQFVNSIAPLTPIRMNAKTKQYIAKEWAYLRSHAPVGVGASARTKTGVIGPGDGIHRSSNQLVKQSDVSGQMSNHVAAQSGSSHAVITDRDSNGRTVPRYQDKGLWAERVYERCQSHGSSDVRASIKTIADARQILDYEIAGDKRMDASTVNDAGYCGPLQFGWMAWYDGYEFHRSYTPLHFRSKYSKARNARDLISWTKRLLRGGPADIDCAVPVAIEFWNRNWRTFRSRPRLRHVSPSVELNYLMHNQGGVGGSGQAVAYLDGESRFFSIGVQSREAKKLASRLKSHLQSYA